MNIRTVDAHVVYRTHMVEVKHRLLAAERISRANAALTGLQALDSEFCFLQVRKVIELVTFSAIKREEGRYRKLRAQDKQRANRDHGDPAKDWQAVEILKSLVSLSPHALPIPIAKMVERETGSMHFERRKISVNHGRLIELYKLCGGYLHAKNPLVPDYAAYVEQERARYIAAPSEVRLALEFLRKLLWEHAVVQLNWSDPNNPTAVDGPKSAWLVNFGATEDEDVTLVLAEAT